MPKQNLVETLEGELRGVERRGQGQAKPNLCFFKKFKKLYKNYKYCKKKSAKI